MKFTNNPQENVDKEPAKRLKTTYLIVKIVGGIVLVFAFIVEVQVGELFGTKPTVVVDCESWRMPCCIKKKLTDPYNTDTHIDPNHPAKFIKEHSLYHIFVSNDCRRRIKRARVKIPDADYVEVKRGDSEPEEAKRYLKAADKSWNLGNMDHGDKIEVNAWTKKKPKRKLRQLAGEIWVNHESNGPAAAPYIRTPAHLLGELTNRYTFWTILAVVMLVFGPPVVVYKLKLCRYLCNLASKPG